MNESTIKYQHDGCTLHGFLASSELHNGPKPGVLVVHDWTGRGEFACDKARMLADMGYVGFAVDMYGDAKTGATNDEKMALMQPLMHDRSLLQGRMLAAYEVLKQIPEVDSTRIAVIGFCFGGLCALDLARTGAAIQGAVSVHGLLMKPDAREAQAINARVLVLHGYDDPMVPPEHVQQFAQEMNEAQCDWQIHMYGRVQHAFTNPNAHDTALGLVFNEVAAQRAYRAMGAFLQELF